MIRKKITKVGSITLPRRLRYEAGILPGVAVDIKNDDEGIHITKHVPACHLCGTIDDVKTVCGIEICIGCAKKLIEAFNENGEG